MKVLSRLTVFSLLVSCAFPPVLAADAIMLDVKEPPALEDVAPSGEETPAYKITLQEALRYTYKHNPTLLAARNQLKATYERLPQARAGWLPNVASTLGVSRVDLEGSNFPGAAGSTEKSVGLSVDQNIFRGGSTFAETAAAKHIIASQSALLDSTEQNILLDAISAYMDVVRDRSIVELQEHNFNVLERQREATEERFAVGELTLTDVSQADARLARSKADIIAARGNLNTSVALFEQIVGLSPHFLEMPHEVAPKIPETLSKAVLMAESASPVITGAVFAHKAAEKDADDVFGELLPQIGAFASWDRAYDPVPGIVEESTTKSFGLSATIPLYQSGAVRSRLRQAKHTANARYMEVLETKRQVKQSVIAAWSSWQASREEIRSRLSQVDAARTANEGVHLEAQYGQRTVLDTLDSDQELLDAQVALVTSQRDEVVAKFRLLATLGQLKIENLNMPAPLNIADAGLRQINTKFLNLHVDRLLEVE